jgi:hypothetical protein
MPPLTRLHRRLCSILLVAVATLPLSGQDRVMAPQLNGPVPGPLPVFPSDNWWNQDVTSAPVDPNSAQFIAFINNSTTPRRLHPDFGPVVSSTEMYGIPFATVDGTQPKVSVSFYYSDESDGHNVPFYPIPEEAKTQPYWIEGGQPGNQSPGGDRHMLLIDKDNRILYELFDLFWNGSQWTAGSGARFDLNSNARRPDGWTSADAAGLAIFPGLVRYDEVYQSTEEIRHAFRFTVRASNGYVWPASHRAGSNSQALPMGARMRLKASKDISGYPAAMQKIFRAMKTYGLIVADNGSDMYISGAHHPNWDNGILNPAFHSLNANDFDVLQLGWRGSCAASSAPAAPTGFAAASNGLQANFSWTLPTTGGSYSTLVLEAGSGPGLANLASVPLSPTATSFSATGPAGTYYVRLRATNACGNVVSSEAILTLGTTCTPPGVPGAPVASVSGSNVSLTWTAGSGATSHVFEAGSAPTQANLLVTQVNGTSISAAAPSGTYYVRTRGRNACGTSAPSADTTVVVGGCTAPGAGSSLTSTVSGRTVTLNWGASSGATEYVLEVGSTTGASNVLVTSMGTLTSFSALAPPGTYFVRIRPRNACGSGGASNEVVITVV